MHDLVRRASLRVVKTAYPSYGLRSSDVILGAFPKSGSTWIRFILANLISLRELEGVEVNYHLINGPLVAAYDSHRFPTIPYSSIPRFVVTHLPYRRRRFGRYRSLHLLRNPGDTMVSLYEYIKARTDKHRFRGSFSDLLRDPKRGVAAWCAHVRSWRPAADATITFEDLQRDAPTAIASVFTALEIGLPPRSVLDQAIERSSFQAIRTVEEEKGLDARARGHLATGFRFARRGIVGEWREAFTADDLRFLNHSLERGGLAEFQLS